MNFLKKVWNGFCKIINCIFRIRVRHSLVIGLLEKTKEEEKAKEYDKYISVREKLE
jgi:hypothetical protein